MNRESYERYSGHLGAILFNIGIVGLLYTAGAVFIPVLWVFALFMLIIIAFYATAFSVGTVWASEFFRNFMTSSFGALVSDDTSGFMATVLNYAQPVMIATGIVLALSAVFLLLDRNNHKSKSRLIAIIIFAVIFVALVIMFATSGGAA